MGAAAFFFASLLPRLLGCRLRHKNFLACKPKYPGKAKTFSHKSPGKHQLTKTPAEMVIVLSREFEIYTKCEHCI